MLKVIFFPSFSEKSEITSFKNDSGEWIKFLIRDNFVDKPADTFYFRTIKLSQEQFFRMDTAIFQKIKVNITATPLGRDGMGVEFIKIQGIDTLKENFWSPRDKNKFAYKITKSAIENFRAIISDTIIAEFLDEITGYIDDQNPNTNRKEIEKIRRERYNKK